MQITTLNLRNFRNYARLDLVLRAGATLFYGPNAAGKTSILEAVALLALSRSPIATVSWCFGRPITRPKLPLPPASLA